LERQHHDVDPGDLRDGNGVGDRQRSLENTIHTSEGLVELNNTGNGLVLVETNFECFVVDDAVDIAGEMVQDFERQVTERLLGALDPLTGVRLGECDAEVFTNSLDLLLVSWLGDIKLSSAGESVQVLNAVAEIGVVDTGFKAEPVLDRAGEGVEKVECRELVEKIFLSEVAFAFGSVVPNGPCQVLANKDQLTPVLSALGVTLVCGACSERNGKTNDETKNGQKKSADFELKYEFRDACDESRPESYYCEW